MKRKILILGSKPGAEIVEHDIVYCANSSGYQYKKELSKYNSRKISCVSCSEIIESKRMNLDKIKWLDNKRKNIFSLKDHEFIFIGKEFFPESEKVILDNCKNTKYTCSFHSLYENFISNELNILFPIIPVSSNKLRGRIFKMVIKYAINIFKYKCGKYLVHSVFRQSTGLNSLIQAIIDNGEQAVYYVSGISFEDRANYQDGTKNTWTPESYVNLNHVLADIRLLNRLCEKYEIYVKD